MGFEDEKDPAIQPIDREEYESWEKMLIARVCCDCDDTESDMTYCIACNKIICVDNCVAASNDEHGIHWCHECYERESPSWPKIPESCPKCGSRRIESWDDDDATWDCLDCENEWDTPTEEAR